MKVTILVAVYNAADTLPRCLDSLLTQTYGDLQIVCIDDCSTDGSLSVLRDYALRDGRIEVIGLDGNVGPGRARNEGLKRAEGEVIAFVDSDDWLAADAVERMAEVFAASPETDCVLFRVIEVEDKKEREYPMESFAVLPGRDAFVRSLNWSIHGVYAVRASIHRQFPYDAEGGVYGDENVTRLHYLNSREVRCCGGIYYYWQNSQSVTHRVDVRRFDYLKANERMKRELQQLNVPEDILNLYENMRWLYLIDRYYFYFTHRRELSPSGAAYGLGELHRVWKTMETGRLDRRGSIHKFGYMPLRFSWFLFRVQEEAYFFLRRILKRQGSGKVG